MAYDYEKSGNVKVEKIPSIKDMLAQNQQQFAGIKGQQTSSDLAEKIAASQGINRKMLNEILRDRIPLADQIENRATALADKLRVLHSLLEILRENPAFDSFLELRDESLL